jgi:hypothetical protein
VPVPPSVCGHSSRSATPGPRWLLTAIAYGVKERLRDFSRTSDPDEACVILDELVHHCRKRAMPPEVPRLGRTLQTWFDKIANFHLARVSNGPTEALNNLVKRIKRIESVNGLYKTELIHRRGPWRNVEHVEWATLNYLDWFNNRRIHNEIGKVRPTEFEQSYYRQIAA